MRKPRYRFWRIHPMGHYREPELDFQPRLSVLNPHSWPWQEPRIGKDVANVSGSFAVMWEAGGRPPQQHPHFLLLPKTDPERPGQAVLPLGASGQAKSRAFQRTQGNSDLVLKPKMRHVTSTSEPLPSCYCPLDGDTPPHRETVSMTTYQNKSKGPF